MNREERLQFCKKCINRKFSREKGIICGLTGEYARFEDSCPDFKEDKIESEKIKKYGVPVTMDHNAVGGGLRFANYIIDRLAVYGLTFVLGMVLGFLNVEFVYNISPLQDALLSILIYILYYVVMEYYFQVTIGKLITGTVVVNMQGNKPEINAILGRSISRIVPFEPFSFLGSSAIGWHDKWSNTRVIKRSDMKKNIQLNEEILDDEYIKEL